jgi:hypothetical protein
MGGQWHHCDSDLALIDFALIHRTDFHYTVKGIAVNPNQELVEPGEPKIMKRYFLIAATACVCSAPVFAQGGGMQMPAGIASEVKQAYNSVKNNLLGAANAMPEADYAFAPVPEEMTFGKWVAHVADSQTGTCSALNGQAKRGDAATKTSKADLVAALQASFAECDTAFNSLTDANALEMVAAGRGQRSRAGTLAGVNVHDNECYGSMAVYLRIKSVVPPSTANRGAMGGMGGGRGASGRGMGNMPMGNMPMNGPGR